MSPARHQNRKIAQENPAMFTITIVVARCTRPPRTPSHSDGRRPSSWLSSSSSSASRRGRCRAAAAAAAAPSLSAPSLRWVVIFGGGGAVPDKARARTCDGAAAARDDNGETRLTTGARAQSAVFFDGRSGISSPHRLPARSPRSRRGVHTCKKPDGRS